MDGDFEIKDIGSSVVIKKLKRKGGKWVSYAQEPKANEYSQQNMSVLQQYNEEFKKNEASPQSVYQEDNFDSSQIQDQQESDDNSPVFVNVSQTSLLQCRDHAVEQQEYAKYNNLGGYGVDQISVRILGIKCEIAVSQWFHSQDYEVKENFWYFDDCPDCDIQLTVNGYQVQVEVKGTKPKTWNQYCRTVLPYQLNKYIRKKAIIVWATTSPSENDPQVHLRGWNTSFEVKQFGIVNHSGNIWLKDDKLMRNMRSLHKYLQNNKFLNKTY